VVPSFAAPGLAMHLVIYSRIFLVVSGNENASCFKEHAPTRITVDGIARVDEP
jgi:hypothetical protein